MVTQSCESSVTLGSFWRIANRHAIDLMTCQYPEMTNTRTVAAEPNFTVDHIASPTRSMRVAFVTETYPPEVNGVALTMARIVNGIAARNHEIQLVRPRQNSENVEQLTDKFHEVFTRGMPIPRYPDLRMGLPSKRALVRLWSHKRPDVVHIATEGPLGWSALQAARLLKLPVCSDFRTNFHAYSKHYGIGWLQRPIMGYLRKFHNRTQATMVPTEALRQELASSGFQRLSVVSRGVEVGLFNPKRRSEALRNQWGAAKDDFVALYVGRLAPEKNLEVLIASFASIKASRPHARFVVVGNGPARAELELRMPYAVFAGQRRGEDLAAHYASADLFIFPSLTETFGNVTVEAMASGLPVLAFDDAAASELITSGENGLLIRFGNGSAFVDAAASLTGKRPWLRYMGERALRRVASLDWEQVVLRFEQVLRRTIDEAHQPGLWAGTLHSGNTAGSIRPL
jgi:glycosyltransferase involved in cell wall biosynthesis